MQVLVMASSVAAVTTTKTFARPWLMTSVDPEAQKKRKKPPGSLITSRIWYRQFPHIHCLASLSGLLVHNNSLLGTQQALELSCDAKEKKGKTEQMNMPDAVGAFVSAGFS